MHYVNDINLVPKMGQINKVQRPVSSPVCDIGGRIYNSYAGGIIVQVYDTFNTERRKHRPVASHWQTLSHNFVSSTPRHDQDYNGPNTEDEKKIWIFYADLNIVLQGFK
jgi:hypothetical protein